MTQHNKTASAGKPRYVYAGSVVPFAKPSLIVEMTPAQQDRQNVQVAWLRAAIDAQNRMMLVEEKTLPNNIE